MTRQDELLERLSRLFGAAGSEATFWGEHRPTRGFVDQLIIPDDARRDTSGNPGAHDAGATNRRQAKVSAGAVTKVSDELAAYFACGSIAPNSSFDVRDAR